MANPTIQALRALVTEAMDTLAEFTGTAEEASRDSVIQDAIEVISAVTPLVEDFGRGTEITPEDVRTSLMDMDSSIAAFDREIERQAGG